MSASACRLLLSRSRDKALAQAVRTRKTWSHYCERGQLDKLVALEDWAIRILQRPLMHRSTGAGSLGAECGAVPSVDSKSHSDHE